MEPGRGVGVGGVGVTGVGVGVDGVGSPDGVAGSSDGVAGVSVGAGVVLPAGVSGDAGLPPFVPLPTPTLPVLHAVNSAAAKKHASTAQISRV